MLNPHIGAGSGRHLAYTFDNERTLLFRPEDVGGSSFTLVEVGDALVDLATHIRQSRTSVLQSVGGNDNASAITDFFHQPSTCMCCEVVTGLVRVFRSGHTHGSQRYRRGCDHVPVLMFRERSVFAVSSESHQQQTRYQRKESSGTKSRNGPCGRGG